MDTPVLLALGAAVAVAAGVWVYLRNRVPTEEPFYHFRCPGCQRRLVTAGLGTVYLAHAPVLDLPSAIKLPPPGVVRAAHALARFSPEARAAARLQHPTVCRVYDVGFSDGHHYLAMAYVDGEPL